MSNHLSQVLVLKFIMKRKDHFTFRLHDSLITNVAFVHNLRTWSTSVKINCGLTFMFPTPATIASKHQQ